MLPAPLITGNDVRTMSEDTKAILLNQRVIAINQDSRAEPARRSRHDPRVLVRHLANDSVAVTMYNPENEPALIGMSTGDIGFTKHTECVVEDLWSTSTTISTDGIAAMIVEPHGCHMVKVTPR